MTLTTSKTPPALPPRRPPSFEELVEQERRLLDGLCEWFRAGSRRPPAEADAIVARALTEALDELIAEKPIGERADARRRRAAARAVARRMREEPRWLPASAREDTWERAMREYDEDLKRNPPPKPPARAMTWEEREEISDRAMLEGLRSAIVELHFDHTAPAVWARVFEPGRYPRLHMVGTGKRAATGTRTATPRGADAPALFAIVDDQVRVIAALEAGRADTVFSSPFAPFR